VNAQQNNFEQTERRRVVRRSAAGVPAPARGRAFPPRLPRCHGMTLVEVLFVVVIILVVMSLLIGSVHMVTRTSRAVTHQVAVNSLKQGVIAFQQEFGFAPPLVSDIILSAAGEPPAITPGGQPLTTTAPRRARIFNLAEHGGFLRHLPDPGEPDQRFSIYTLPYYLIGVIDDPRDPANPNSGAIDGVPGPGFRTPRRDGTFSDSGRIYQPFFAVGSGSTSLYTDTATGGPGRVELRDANGIAFRYYRWEPKRNPLPSDNVRERLRIPYIVGEPETDPSLRIARYAIVGAGPDRLFGNEFQLPAGHPQYIPTAEMTRRLSLASNAPAGEIFMAASSDNIVEVLR
jgi:prepilin-type N-terminal cleavage/methylation domain-containing protein